MKSLFMIFVLYFIRLQVTTPGITGTGYAVADTEAPTKSPIVTTQKQAPPKPSSPLVPKPASPLVTHPTRPHYRTRPQQPPVRIDTCIVGDDTTCDMAQNEKCKTDAGVSSCHCRPGTIDLAVLKTGRILIDSPHIRFRSSQTS